LPEAGFAMIPTGFNEIFLRKIVLPSLERQHSEKKSIKIQKASPKKIEAIKYFRCWKLEISESGMVDGQILLLLLDIPICILKAFVNKKFLLEGSSTGTDEIWNLVITGLSLTSVCGYVWYVKIKMIVTKIAYRIFFREV